MYARLGILAAAAAASLALAQADEPTVFVANQGNLEGSVSSFSIDPDGTPVFIDKLITGSRPSTSVDNPGTNTIALSVSPSGAYLATGHATGSASGDYVSILGVNADATMSIVLQHLMPETTYSVAWVDDTFLAVTQTVVFGTNELVIFAFDAESETLTEVDRAYCGTFATTIAKNPTNRVVYVNDSGSVKEIYGFEVGVDGSLTQIQNISLATYPLGIEVGPSGRSLYAAAGISGGGHAFRIFDLDGDGLMSPNAGNPYTSPGSSPKGFSVDPTGTLLFVQHGTDATIRSFFLDEKTGGAIPTGQSFDVGSQGTLGGSDAWGGYLFVTNKYDSPRGLHSLAINLDTGAMTPVTATAVDTTGISPESVRVWDPASVGCRADLAADGVLDFFDVAAFLQLFADGDLGADFTDEGILDFFDVAAFLQEFADGCP